MVKPILIWGAGAIGGTIGAHLARAGQHVVLVDTAADHVAAMAANGLAIEGPLGGFSMPVTAVVPENLSERYSRVLLAVKSQHTEAACRAILPHLTDNGYVVSCQNGLNETTIAAIIGRGRTIGAFVNFAGDYLAPGRITYGLRGTFAIGELDGSASPRIRELRATLENFEPSVTISYDIFGFLWAKTAYAMVLTAQALTNDTIADFIASPTRRDLITALVQEALSVARAEGVVPSSFDTFEPRAFIRNDRTAIDDCLDALAAFNRGTGKTHSGIWRDLAVRKRKTEVSAQFVPIRQAAERHGLKMPLAEKLVALIEAVEAGKRVQGDALADEISALLAAQG